MTTTTAPRAPDWDIEQLEVIMDSPSAWQVVTAGPGAGKSAVACQRVAFLIDQGVPPARILLISFTRTAVAELRDRIVSYSVAGERARSVRIATVDSHAWNLRSGFADDEVKRLVGDGSHEASIEQTVALFREKNADLLDFMQRLEHLIIDEAQDVMGARSDLIMEMLKSLSPECGVTVLADPAQAIYGFTTDDEVGDDASVGFLELLARAPPRKLATRTLSKNHRVKNEELINVFVKTRQHIDGAERPEGHIALVQETIRQNGEDVGVTPYENIAKFLSSPNSDSKLVLYRWRADVLYASSYCSGAGVEHRLRMSELPVVVRPWLGWLFGGYTSTSITRDEMDSLWARRAAIASAPFDGEATDGAWNILHRLAAGRQPRTIDLVQLRALVGRARPPVELCYPDLGTRGPILGTIHASKGREADTVVLVMPKANARHELSPNEVFEEGRVYYVGATRARKMLVVAGSAAARVGRLDSGRIYCKHDDNRAQLEVGRAGDVDRLAHLGWSGAEAVQSTLAMSVGRTIPVVGSAREENKWAIRLTLERKDPDGVTRFPEIGQMSAGFKIDMGRLWSRVDENSALRPSESIPHLYMVAVTTVALSDEEMAAVKAPFKQSGFGLAPVIKGFPMIKFLYRSRRGHR